MKKGTKVVKQIRSSIRQIKRAYTLTITRLLTDYFFQNTEAPEGLGRLQKVDIEKRVKAAYDLRSVYVHSGVNYGPWTHSHNLVRNEIQLGTPIIHDDDDDYAKAVAAAPTYLGLERIMRYCLLRFIHLHGIPIDSRLNDPAPADKASLKPEEFLEDSEKC